jgi:hypothetical protein
LFQQAYQIGPFIIKLSLISVVLSVVFAYLITKYRLKTSHVSKLIIEGISNGVIIAFIIWKFSYVIFNPIRAIENPMAILYFSGGSLGSLLGVLTAIVYIAFYLRKHKILVFHFVDAAFIAIVSYTVLNSGLLAIIETIDRYVYLTIFLITLIFLIWLLKLSFPIKESVLLELILWWSILQIIADFFKSSLPFIASFSTEQVIYITVSIVIVAIQLLQRKKTKGE